MLLKIGFVAFLRSAHQRFLQNKGLMLIIIMTLMANLIVSFLHELVLIRQYYRWGGRNCRWHHRDCLGHLPPIGSLFSIVKAIGQVIS